MLVAQVQGRVLGTAYIRANQLGGGAHVANAGYAAQAVIASEAKQSSPVRKALRIPGLLRFARNDRIDAVRPREHPGASPRLHEEPPPDRGRLRAMSEITKRDGRGALRLSVDLNRCQAYAQCCYAAPEQFVLHGREALFYDPSPPADAWAEVERARVACPVQAIRLECPGAKQA